MKKEHKIALCTFLLILGITVFTLQVFVFSAPDGTIGLILCLASVYLMLGSIINLYRLSEKFQNFIRTVVDFLFWIV